MSNTKQELYEKIIKKIDLNNLKLKIDSPEKLKNLLCNVNKFMTKRLEDADGEECLKWFLKKIKRYEVLLAVMNLYNQNSSTYKEELIKNLNKYSHKTILKIIDEALSKKYIIYKNDNNGNNKKKLIEPSLELLTAYINWNIKHISNYSRAIKKMID
tara:strand:+ start:2122 stop:2592 length:471 start_codon:yes stop_codon:yes gene_type:complete